MGHCMFCLHRTLCLGLAHPQCSLCVYSSLGGCCPQAFGLCKTSDLTYCLGIIGCLTVVFISLTK